jgi:mannose-6-phosphate isomerase-like protein (cupin superfamily)
MKKLTQCNGDPMKAISSILEENHSKSALLQVKLCDQFFRIEAGQGKCILHRHEYKLKDRNALVIPAGAKHNIINTDKDVALKMYTIYSPAHHKDGSVRATKADALAHEEEFDGVTTEAVTA